MSSHRWLSLLLLLCVLCFALFSVSSIAYGATEQPSTYRLEQVDNNGAYLDFLYYSRDIASDQYWSTLYTVNGFLANSERGFVYDVNVSNFYSDSYYLCQHIKYYKNNGNTVLANEGSTINFDMNGFTQKGFLSTTDSSSGMNSSTLFNTSRISVLIAFLLDSNGNTISTHHLPLSSITSNGNDTYNISFKIENVSSDVYAIGFEMRYKYSQAFNGFSASQLANTPYKFVSIGYNSFLDSSVNVSVDDGTSGLLKGIIGIVTNIKDGVSNLISGITELPSKLWNLIENGLKGLFVPTESEMTDIKNQWDTLLSDRFGGLYQTVNLIDGYADSFKDPNDKNTITLPELKLPFGSAEFVFGGQEVQIVPDKFSFLIDVIKTIISIIATCLFVNGLRNRFERLVGGQE